MRIRCFRRVPKVRKRLRGHRRAGYLPNPSLYRHYWCGRVVSLGSYNLPNHVHHLESSQYSESKRPLTVF
nr:hypothetical protein [Okeania sp. SIO2B3]